jgi:protein AroM
MMTKLGIILCYRLNAEREHYIRGSLETDAEMLIVGSQDGMSDAELRQMDTGESTSFAETLADGSTVFLSEQTVTDNACKAAEKLKRQGASVAMIFDSFPLPALRESGVITPSDLLEHAALSMRNQGSISVLQPIKEVMEREIQHWQALGVPLVHAYAPPLMPGSPDNAQVEERIRNAPDEHLNQAALSLVEQGAEVIVLDCFAYGDHHRELVFGVTAKPVILPTAYIGVTLNSMYCLAEDKYSRAMATHISGVHECLE